MIHKLKKSMQKNAFLPILLVLTFLVPVAAQNKPFPFAVVGDTGCDCAGQEVVSKQMYEWYKKKPFGMVLMLGDNVYGDGSFFGGKGGGHPDLFIEHFDEYFKPLLDNGVKFFATLGNHDMEADGGRSMIADKKRFHMIGNLGFYSFEPEEEQGLITFYAVNSVTMVKGLTDKGQIQWLTEALAKDRSTWKVVFMHHPIYTAVGGHRIDEGLLAALEPVLVKGGVQLVLSGHNHYYARTKPIHGITHITSGGGGRSLVSIKSTGQLVKAVKTYQFMYFEASFGRLDYWAIDGDGREIDRGFIEPRPVEQKSSPASQ
jgi:3',5'-cyclic AMP phosphodiesterase CpdA